MTAAAPRKSDDGGLQPAQPAQRDQPARPSSVAKEDSKHDAESSAPAAPRARKPPARGKSRRGAEPAAGHEDNHEDTPELGTLGTPASVEDTLKAQAVNGSA